MSLLLLEVHNSGKLVSEQASTTNQASIDITHGHQTVNTLRRYTSSILDPHGLCDLVVIHFSQHSPNELVHLVRIFSIAHQTSSELFAEESAEVLQLEEILTKV